ncbi:MAG: DEAD/DEAH box helicase [Acidobacteriota bacterium]|nr:DEAD/DEAH box helicase [Acidobacteriota bacterium]
MAAAPDLNLQPATALAWAHPVVQEWFLTKFGSATEPQEEGWPVILRGDTTLISAPTGSGKTLAAFLVAIDQLLRLAIEGALAPVTQVVYVSPLKALSNDVQKNLDGPLAEIQQLAAARGYLCPSIRTGVRTGDTLPIERARMLRNPPHILVTTPESLYLLLTAGKSREHLRHVRTVIVDEIHAVADDKRGSHLALSLERLDALVCGENRLSPGAFTTAVTARVPHPRSAWVGGSSTDRAPQRIGLSATQNPIELVGEFLAGANPETRVPHSSRTDESRPNNSLVPHSSQPHRDEWDADSSRREPVTIIQVGQRRQLDLAIEIPSDELGSVTTNSMWEEVFDKLAAHALNHRSTLVFVNTRRLVEKIAFALSERLTPQLGPDCVAAHHGSLARELRLDAEQRLKNGEIRILVATASLELGIDIGNVDLVCQIASTRAVAVAMQRVGRAGHWRGAIPKGRLFATTRDDLLEQAALVRKMRAGELDLLEVPPQPVDVLMQQIVAMVGAEPWEEDALFNVVRRAYPYRKLTRALFDEIVKLLSEGIESSRGRYGAYLLRDGVHRQLHPRRGSRSIAIANGGAIPDTALFNVILQPEGVQIATLDEHFAVDSGPGDVILLGNTSWRVKRVEAAGRVLVEDAHGAPPSLPFWFGEAPQRTAVLCDGVGELREHISASTLNVSPTDLGLLSPGNSARVPHPSQSHRDGWGTPATDGHPAITYRGLHPEVAATTAWLMDECGVCASAAQQLIAYIVAGRAVLGAVPSKTTIIAERFFDEGGGMQLILHAPFGGRLNKAWGLALRKRFCRGFNFELQAAATDNGINISLAEQHSFPLADVFHFLTENTAKELLEQAAIASPIFKTRWRWAANRSLQLLRMSKGKRIAPQIQRTRSDDLLASVFPQAAACFETIVGDIQIPDHPLVNEVMQDVLQDAMDLEGLNKVLRGIATGAIRCLAVDTPVPSQFAHELLNANPYAFLDEAGLEERRARSVTLRRALPDSVLDGAGRLDQAAIDTVRSELWPDLRDEHELHDLLHSLVALPISFIDNSTGAPSFAASSQRVGLTNDVRHWPHYFDRLTENGRAQIVDLNGVPCWAATERLSHIDALHVVIPTLSFEKGKNPLISPEVTQNLPLGNDSESVTKEAAVKQCVQGWVQILGPTTASDFAERLGLDPTAIFQAFLAMEMQGLLMRGVFERPATEEPHAIEWCERRILQRIHRLTLATARKQVEPVPPAVYMRWLLGWQHLAPQTQLSGEEGVMAALHQLEGFEAPAVEWERTLLPARVANYSPAWLDQLCLSGAVGWGRISPHPAWSAGDGGAPRRVIPTNAAPITFYTRETAEWLPHALNQQSVDEKLLAAALSPEALRIRDLLQQRGACFANDLQRITSLTRQETAHALWELATAGLAAADGFDQLRALMDPRRKATTTETSGKRTTRTTAGRWSLLIEPTTKTSVILSEAKNPRISTDAPRNSEEYKNNLQAAAIARARRTDTALESFARMLLARYGVLFRDLLARESNAPKWRELLNILRRLEARGEVRGGRFVTGFGGEQFALPEAVESLRDARKHESQHEIAVAAADPLNLVGIIVPGERVPAVPGREVRYRNGSLLIDAAESAKITKAPTTKTHRFISLIPQPLPIKSAPPAPTLF